MAVWLRLMALITKSNFKFSRLSFNLQTACSRRKGWGRIVDYTPGRRVRRNSFGDALPLEHNQDRQHKGRVRNGIYVARAHLRATSFACYGGQTIRHRGSSIRLLGNDSVITVWTSTEESYTLVYSATISNKKLSSLSFSCCTQLPRVFECVKWRWRSCVESGGSRHHHTI